MPDDPQNPALSVVMPVWNGEAYLREAIQSILDQTFTNFEFLIIDDGSTDGTLEIIKNYNDARIRLFQREHGGIVKALNFGVAEAKAGWIARMDADDVAYPKRFELQLQKLNCTPNSIACYTNVTLIEENGVCTKSQHFPRTMGLLAAKLCYQSPITHSSVIFKKTAFLTVGGYRENERHAEDFSLWGRMLELGTFLSISNPLMKLRIHQQSISKQKSDIQRSLTVAIAKDHCRRFMNLEPKISQRAYLALQPGNRKVFEWLWFVGKCLPRLKWQSLELWGWIAMQTVRRISGIFRFGNR